MLIVTKQANMIISTPIPTFPTINKPQSTFVVRFEIPYKPVAIEGVTQSWSAK